MSATPISMRELLEAGVHFGHQTRRWHPRMKPFIYGERNGIHIVNLQYTLPRFRVACEYLRGVVAEGGTVLFVSTKRQAQDQIAEQARACGMPFVHRRWLGKRPLEQGHPEPTDRQSELMTPRTRPHRPATASRRMRRVYRSSAS